MLKVTIIASQRVEIHIRSTSSDRHMTQRVVCSCKTTIAHCSSCCYATLSVWKCVASCSAGYNQSIQTSCRRQAHCLPVYTVYTLLCIAVVDRCNLKGSPPLCSAVVDSQQQIHSTVYYSTSCARTAAYCSAAAKAPFPQ